MARRSNKSLEATLTAAEATTARKDEDDLEIQRKVDLAIEGFTTSKYCELVLKDRIRLSKENALVVYNYIIAMKREVNARLNTIKTTIQFLSELSSFR
jgi:tRNA(Ser,Leu) C12 N-acetylase TAN1